MNSQKSSAVICMLDFLERIVLHFFFCRWESKIKDQQNGFVEGICIKRIPHVKWELNTKKTEHISSFIWPNWWMLKFDRKSKKPCRSRVMICNGHDNCKYKNKNFSQFNRWVSSRLQDNRICRLVFLRLFNRNLKIEMHFFPLENFNNSTI